MSSPHEKTRPLSVKTREKSVPAATATACDFRMFAADNLWFAATDSPCRRSGWRFSLEWAKMGYGSRCPAADGSENVFWSRCSNLRQRLKLPDRLSCCPIHTDLRRSRRQVYEHHRRQGPQLIKPLTIAFEKRNAYNQI